MAKQTRTTRIEAALERVAQEISGSTDRNSRSSAGLSREGYAGGYEQGLRDALRVLAGVRPNTRNYWQDWRDPVPDPDSGAKTGSHYDYD